MQALAIDDHVSTKLYAWYTFVSAWVPPGQSAPGICQECVESALACTIDIQAWPHDVIHVLVQSLRSAVRDVHDSYCEEFQWDCTSAPDVAHAAVRDTLMRYAPDINDVLDQCLTERLETWVATQVDDDLDLRRLAAS